MTQADPDIENLVGSGPGPRRGRPSTRQKEAAEKLAQENRDRLSRFTRERRLDEGVRDPERWQMQDFHRGVPVAVLAQIFRMDPATVKKRLADCPPKDSRKAGYLYDLAQAASYLIKPVFDVKKYMSTMKPSEMPSALQQAYWDAALKKQKWEENAQDLWRTERVQEVLADVFKTIKQTIQLWPDTITESTSVTDAQRRALVLLGDSLQTDIYNALVENARAKATLSTSSELNEVDDMDASHLV